MSEQLLAKLMDYGLAGLILLYLGKKIDKVDETLKQLCLKLSP